MGKPDRILFLTLQTFSATGGIEKMCRLIAKAIFDLSLTGNNRFDVHSLHDTGGAADKNKYFPSERFRGFGGGSIRFIIASLISGRKCGKVILSHVNLIPVGWLIKKFSPGTRVFLYCHGIEIWDIPLGFRRHMLASVDLFFCVSGYTKEKLMTLHGVPENRCRVINNCLDPFLPAGNCLEHFPDLRPKYGIAPGRKIMITLSRMNAAERYKGYDKVIRILPELTGEFPDLVFVMGGKADEPELAYIRELIGRQGVEDRVILAGYVADIDLPAFFSMGDLFVMPSHNEGFGIVFIESLYFGLPVVAGNRDGSRDVMVSDSFGKLADPFSEEDILVAIRQILKQEKAMVPDRKLLLERFGFDRYKARLAELLAA